MELLPALALKKNEDRRLKAGHLWIFSNEVDTAKTPLTALEPGQLVDIQASNGKSLGTGYANPNSLICARLVSRDPSHQLDRSLLHHRFNIALSLRERLYDQPFYRLLYGESDGLPGLVVDRYDETLVAQITTAGMERAKPAIVEALEKTLRFQNLIFRNDNPLRALEGLASYTEVAIGDLPDAVEVTEGPARFVAPLAAGQKTGWFFDQRDNRERLSALVRDKTVLDVFSYVGAWGIRAALAGARQVSCVDSSATALQAVVENARRNGMQERVETLAGDAFEVMAELRRERRRFDVVIIDPPAFIKRRKDLRNGLNAYRALNQAAMQLLERDGMLVSASCSYHLPREELRHIIQGSARHLDRFAQILYQGHQGPDHPVHPAIPETEYLKAFFARILPN